jgi:hypothetical protein
VRNAAVCPAINAFRQSLVGGARFGGTDIFGGSYLDPTTP